MRLRHHHGVLTNIELACWSQNDVCAITVTAGETSRVAPPDLCVPIGDLNTLPNLTSSTSLLVHPQHCEVYLFEDVNYGGALLGSFSALPGHLQTHQLRESIADEVSSIIMFGPCVKVWDEDDCDEHSEDNRVYLSNVPELPSDLENGDSSPILISKHEIFSSDCLAPY